MSIRAFRILQAIARHGSFTRAGEAVGLTQSAVSLQVKGLEEEFGVRLLDRTRHRPVFTDAGMIVLAKAEEILALYDQIEPALSDEQSLAGRLRLGAIQSALNGILPQALAVLNREHPASPRSCRGRHVSGSRFEGTGGELDVAITSEPVRPYPQDLIWSAAL